MQMPDHVQCKRLSYVLMNLGIRHTVTVGDIELADGLYIDVTIEQLLQGVEEGYELDIEDGVPVGRPINAHAWITLENGVVIDATVLASQHRKSPYASRLLCFKDAVYYSGKEGTPVVRHIPMMTGFVYLQKVRTMLGDRECPTYCQWYVDYAKVMGKLDLKRLVPAMKDFR